MSAPPVSRRAALRLATLALSGSVVACGRPEEETIPYVRMPERLVAGIPLRFATCLPLDGYGRGVIATSFEGRPVKVEGNPAHPASLGATDPYLEAAVLSLYDPDRSRAPREQVGQVRRPAAWETLLAQLNPRLDALERRGGEGLHLLTGRISSPTLLRQIDALRDRFPHLAWHRHEAIHDDNAMRGSALAFGRRLDTLPRLDAARVVLALDADPLGPGPDQLRLARGFGTKRRARAAGSDFLRLYAVEPGMSLTGSNADHRLALPPAGVHDFALAVAGMLGADVPKPALAPDAQRFAEFAVQDLRDHAGAALVLAGAAMPPEIHALAHWINAQLRAPVDHVEPVDPVADGHVDSLASLAEALHAGEVDTLVVIGANPAYDAPADLRFAEAMRRAAFALHLGLTEDETAALCRWHVPQSHPLEEWSDLRAPDGTASLMQPLIRPLYASRSPHELLPVLAGRPAASPYEAVRATWQGSRAPDAFEPWWRAALHAGIVPDTASPRVSPPTPRLPPVAPAALSPQGGLVLSLRPGAAVWDGRFGNNAWLQELPQPVTRQCWGNAALLAPADAKRLGLGKGDVVRLSAGGFVLEAPVLEQPGQAAGTVQLALGYGRSRAGAIGNTVGSNGYALRRRDAVWTMPVGLEKAGRGESVVTVQGQHRLDGEDRKLLPSMTLSDFEDRIGAPLPAEKLPSLYDPYDYDGAAWAMVIDTTLCIGCNSCVTACQAENNIPVVGPSEVANGRAMHWIRIDTYNIGTEEQPRPGFEPVPCMHCEQAPCEPVCPVAASVHDHEGLNVQVYNRCIGTRFCQSNCPYKVRRFNWFGYNNGQEYANQGDEIVAAQHNPEVTVRARGVMEKCTYCVQRISTARRAAEKEHRPVGADEVRTACQSACPTQAIVFGDLKHPQSPVAPLRREPHHFALLAEQNTRPRTTYLSRVRDTRSELDPEGA